MSHRLVTEDFQHVIQAVTGIKLEDCVVDVLYDLFDENGKY